MPVPKPDPKKLLETMKAIDKEYGDGSVFGLDTKKADMKIARWSTGIEDLDRIIGGGMPYGRVIEICGPESAGKTSLAYHLMAQHPVAVDIPVEGTFDAQRAKAFGNRKGQLIVRRAEYGEQCLESVMAFAEAGVPCIVIDSVPHMITKKQFEQTDMEKENRMAQVASLLSQKLPQCVAKCEKVGTTLIFINQLRDNMNAALFGPKTHTPGGWALRHADSLKLEVRRREWIKVPNKNPKNSAGHEVIGIVMNVKVAKSKICNPLNECVLVLFFDKGFVPPDQLKDIRAEIMKERNRRLKETGSADLYVS